MSEAIKLMDNKYWSTQNIMYDSSTILSNILTVDNVVATGSNENGTYIHLNSGLLICFKKIAYSATASQWAQWGAGVYQVNIGCGTDLGFDLGAPAKSFSHVPFTFLTVEWVSGVKPIFSCHNEAGLASPSHLGVADILSNTTGATSGYLHVIAIGLAA